MRVLEDQITIDAGRHAPHEQNRRGRRWLPVFESNAQRIQSTPNRNPPQKLDLFVHEDAGQGL